MKLTKKEQQLYELARQIQTNDGTIIITGSLALKMHDLELEKECEDLDVYIEMPYSEDYDSFGDMYDYFNKICKDNDLIKVEIPNEDYEDNSKVYYFKAKTKDGLFIHVIFEYICMLDPICEYFHNLSVCRVEDILSAKIRHGLNSGNKKHLPQVINILEYYKNEMEK